MLKISAHYLEKQKHFIPKKIWTKSYGQDSSFHNQQMATWWRNFGVKILVTPFNHFHLLWIDVLQNFFEIMNIHICLAFCLISASFAMNIDKTGSLLNKNYQKSDIKPGKQKFYVSNKPRTTDRRMTKSLILCGPNSNSNPNPK